MAIRFGRDLLHWNGNKSIASDTWSAVPESSGVGICWLGVVVWMTYGTPPEGDRYARVI